jgi:hypothetical protein
MGFKEADTTGTLLIIALWRDGHQERVHCPLPKPEGSAEGAITGEGVHQPKGQGDKDGAPESGILTQGLEQQVSGQVPDSCLKLCH